MFSLIRQCEKCGNELYPGLEETSSNSCQCQNQSKKSSFEQFVFDHIDEFRLDWKNTSEDLSIKGRGFFAAIDQNGLLSFQFIFTKE